MPATVPYRAPKKQRRPNPETLLQQAVLELLGRHPSVAWAKRINTGAGMVGHRDKKTGEVKNSRFMRFGFKGCSDIIGQLRDGRFLAVECKRVGEAMTPEQQEFLEAVRGARGVAFAAYDPLDVMRCVPAPGQAALTLAAPQMGSMPPGPPPLPTAQQSEDGLKRLGEAFREAGGTWT